MILKNHKNHEYFICFYLHVLRFHDLNIPSKLHVNFYIKSLENNFIIYKTIDN